MKNTGLPRRIGAMLYDALLVVALLWLVTIPFIALRGGEAVEMGENALYRVALFVAIYAFFVGFWSRKGRTLGMQSWRLQLEDTGGGSASFTKCSIRFFASLLSWIPAGLGFWWQLWDKEHLTWHDRLSGTRIVYYPKTD